MAGFLKFKAWYLNVKNIELYKMTVLQKHELITELISNSQVGGLWVLKKATSLPL